MTENFEERTSIRSWSSMFLYLSVFIASAVPPMIVSKTQRTGGTLNDGWRNVGISFGILITMAILICWHCTEGKEIPAENKKAEKPENIVKSYISLFQLKPVKYLAASVVLWSMVTSMASSGPVYLMTNNLNYSAGRQSVFFILLSIFALFWIPVINYLSRKFDKKNIYCCAMMLSGIGMSCFAFIGFPNFGFMVGQLWLTVLGIQHSGHCSIR